MVAQATGNDFSGTLGDSLSCYVMMTVATPKEPCWSLFQADLTAPEEDRQLLDTSWVIVSQISSGGSLKALVKTSQIQI